MHKVLIIGSTGMLGSALIARYGVRQAFGIDHSLVDIADKVELTAFLKQARPRLIINAAAYNAVDACEESQEEALRAFSVNGDGVRNLAAYAARNDIPFISFSSDYVFDGRKGVYIETDTPKPPNVYGASKLAGETALQDIARSHPVWQWYLVRTSKLFGKPGSSPTGKRSFFDKIRESMANATTVEAIDGETSCFTYVPDLAEAVLSLQRDVAAPGIYHLVNETPVTWYAGAVALAKLVAPDTRIVPVSPEHFSRPAPRPASSVLMNTKRPVLRPYTEALHAFVREI